MTTVAKLKAYVEKQMALDPYEYLDGDDARKLLALQKEAYFVAYVAGQHGMRALRAALRALEED